MNRKPMSDQQQYRMSYYPGGVAAPAGYAVAIADRPGLYATSPYATVPSPYVSGQPSLPPTMQQYTAVQQQYAVVSQPSPFPSSPHAAAPTAYYASPTAAGYTAQAPVPLSSLQTMTSSSAQLPYLGTQYAPRIGVQAAVVRPSPIAAGSYGGGSLYAMSAYNGLPAMSAQASRAPYSVGPVGYATGVSLPPTASNPTYPSANAYDVSPY